MAIGSASAFVPAGHRPSSLGPLASTIEEIGSKTETPAAPEKIVSDTSVVDGAVVMPSSGTVEKGMDVAVPTALIRVKSRIQP